MDNLTMRKQTVDLLGFLRGQLSSLSGIPTLCYELIQNADDVKDLQGRPGATKIIFDVCDDALFVYNDGVFREIDFYRMEKVSWGNKREEAETTGAFGIGFVSVYQITDSPEIFSSGKHWKFFPEEGQIQPELVETKETKFKLDWAFETSEIRKELGIPPLKRDDLNGICNEISQAIESAALFLKQVTLLELRRNGNTVRKIETVKVGNQLLIDDGDQQIKWWILQGTFEEEERKLRSTFGESIEQKRQSIVKLAIPDTPNDKGLLYAFLPSETRTGLPFHINSDFYPTQDRKRIIFDTSHKAMWNQAAIKCAARILSENAEALLDFFPNEQFWEFISYLQKASQENDLSVTFQDFWELILPEIQERKSLLTNSNKLVIPNEAFFLDSKELINAQEIFESIDINTAHKELRRFRNILIDAGVKLPRVSDICKSFQDKGLIKRYQLGEMPEKLRSLSNWEIFGEAINDLWNKAATYDRAYIKQKLQEISIAFGSDGAVWPPNEIYQADDATKEFFSKISSVIWFDDKFEGKSISSQLVPFFSVDEALETLESAQDELGELLQESVYLPQEMRDWFETHRTQLDHENIQNLRDLKIWPSAGNQLNKLSELYIAGDFEDPLHIARLVDIDALGGGRDFLERTLNVNKLDFITYVSDWIPNIMQNRSLDTQEKIKLTHVLAENLGKLRGYQIIRDSLADLPLVWCGGDDFFPSAQVWFDSKEVRDVLGADINLVQLPLEKAEAVQEFYRWIEVSSEPKPKQIVNRVRMIAQEPPTQEKINRIGRIVSYIARKWLDWDDDEKSEFATLRRINWLPASKDNSQWFKPESVYSIYSKSIFESQGNFLSLEPKIQYQTNTGDFFKFLGIESQPTTDLVVKHLLFSSRKGSSVTADQIYIHLRDNLYDPAIISLIGQKCLYLKNPEGEGSYFTPDQVFWEQHSFGKYRYRLSPDYGNYKELFDKIGVKEKPDCDDAINVLLEISEKYGQSNISMNEAEDEEILIMCWKIINEAFENDQISAESIRKRLGNKKTILDIRKMLTQPTLMFFEDRPGWAEKFKVVKNNITPRYEGAWMGMEAAGVRALSSVVKTEIVTCDNSVETPDLTEKINERKNLIKRVIEEYRKKGISNLDLNNLIDISFFKAENLEIVRTFEGFNKIDRSDLERVDAILIDNRLHYTKLNDQFPWLGIARELSFAIDTSGELQSFRMELMQILLQSVEEATNILNDLGYSKVETAETNIGDGTILVPGEEDLEGLRVSVIPPEAGLDGSDRGTIKGLAEPGGNTTPTSTLPGRAIPVVGGVKRKTSRLRSYVYSDDVLATNVEDPSINEKRNRVASIGVKLVMEFERHEGREPLDMETVQVHHPGYDIESNVEGGKKRYIEVKSLSGDWSTGNPAQLTKTEFETAKKIGENYWLYVVAKAESDEPKIFKIQNPANRVNYYMFDDGWEPIILKE